MAWETLIESSFLTVTADYEFIKDSADTDALVVQLTPGEVLSGVFHYDAAGTNDDLEIQILQGHRISNGNGLDGATSASDVELNTTNDAHGDDERNGQYLIMTSGGERGEGRQISDSVGADDGVNLTHALSAQPSASETYALYQFGEALLFRLKPAATTSSDNDPLHTRPFSIDGRNGEFVAFRARRVGATDAHRVQLIAKTNGINL